MLTATYSPDRPVGLLRTLAPLKRGTGDPTFRVDATGVWRTLRAPTGAATLHLARTPEGVVATAWGAGAEWAIEGVPELLGEGDEWSELDVSGSAVLAASRHRNPGLRIPRTRQVFEMMVAAVLEQKVTGEQARQSWRVLLRRYGEPAPGPAPEGMHVFPTVEVWRRVPSWEWHRAGVGPERSAAILRAAGVAASLERTLEKGRGGVEVEGALRSIPGIGVWTAAETMQRAHGDPDRPSFGDYHLPALVGWVLVGQPVDDDGMRELLEPWAGHRHRVMRLIENSGVAKPRFGPRMTIEDHRGR